MIERINNDKWLKAAVIGSLWGASEIVLGSFLHNLKIPFSGNLLTSIGIVIMIAGHRLWPERGIIIRAGLICAALKTMSPSASIMGPMIAITMQATLMESALLVGRSTWFGYLLGGGLAMSWNIFHRIFTSIVLYGGTLIELYKSLIDYFIRQTGWQVEGYLAPILLLSTIFFVTGMAAATAGIYISKLAQSHRATATTIDLQQAARTDKSHLLRKGKGKTVKQRTDTASDHVSNDLPGYVILLRIVVIIALLVAAMMSITRLPLAIAAAILCTYLFAVWKYDVRLLGRFIYKKGFWISMGIMLLLSALLLKQDQSDTAFSLAGLRAGVEMIMRAMYVITGFGLLSKELRSRSLITWFEHMHMKGFLDAIRLSFQTTPLIIENMPEKSSWKRPSYVLSTMLAGMEDVYDQMKSSPPAPPAPTPSLPSSLRPSVPQSLSPSVPSSSSPSVPPSLSPSLPQSLSPSFPTVLIITGTKGSGKSTMLTAAVDELKRRGIHVSGILAPELVENGERVGYYVQDAATGERMVLCRKEGEREGERDEGQDLACPDSTKRNISSDRTWPVMEDCSDRTRPVRGNFVFDEQAIAFGEEIIDINRKGRGVIREERSVNIFAKMLSFFSLRPLRITSRPLRLDHLIVIDELGPFELKGEGWARAMDRLQQTYNGPMIWVVRESLIDAMLQRWPAEKHQIIHAADSKVQDIMVALQ